MATAEMTKSLNGIDLIVLNDTVSAIKQNPELGDCRFRARNHWTSGTQNQTFIADFYAAKQEMRHRRTFHMNSDEPPMLAGEDQAPNPVEHLLNALASCVTTSLVAHAAVRGIQLDEVESELEGEIDLRGFLGLSKDTPKGFTSIRLVIRAKGPNASAEDLKKLATFSPVFNTLTQGTEVDLRVLTE